MFLETERLLLRKFREEDFADFCEYAIDPEMCRMMGRENIHAAVSARPTFEWLLNREERAYALIYRETGKVIGNLTVYNSFPTQNTVKELEGKTGRSLSFSLSRQYQRRGLMFEAVSSVIDHLFHTEGADYIVCGHFDFNIPSRELLKKLGFSYLTTERFEQNGEERIGIETILWRK